MFGTSWHSRVPWECKNNTPLWFIETLCLSNDDVYTAAVPVQGPPETRPGRGRDPAVSEQIFPLEIYLVRALPWDEIDSMKGCCHPSFMQRNLTTLGIACLTRHCHSPVIYKHTSRNAWTWQWHRMNTARLFINRPLLGDKGRIIISNSELSWSYLLGYAR